MKFIAGADLIAYSHITHLNFVFQINITDN